MTKLANPEWDKTQKLKCDKTQELKMWQNSKTQKIKQKTKTVTKIQICQSSKTPNMTKFKNSKFNKT